MSKDLTDLQLLTELQPVVEKNLNRHMSMRKDWNPHDYIPWSDGKNFYALGGQEWDPEQSKLSEVARIAMITNLLTEDNLPSYHREIAMNFSMDGPWGFWVNRWTAEENRHGIALRVAPRQGRDRDGHSLVRLFDQNGELHRRTCRNRLLLLGSPALQGWDRHVTNGSEGL